MGLKISLTKGYKAFIDENDLARVKQHSWNVHLTKNHVYAESRIKNQKIRLHRFIMDAPKGSLVDHINGNGLDNRKENLRITNMSVNGHNWHTPRKNKSGIRGVHESLGGWEASLVIQGRRMLKWFRAKKDAALQRKLWENIYIRPLI